MKLLGYFCLCLGLLATPAAASIILAPPTITGSGPYVWSYDASAGNLFSAVTIGNASLTPCTVVVPGGTCQALITIYDFAGYIPGTAFGPANWQFSSANLGTTPLQLLPLDDPGIPNLTWIYTGSPIQINANTLYNIGKFGAQSIFNLRTLDDYSTRDAQGTETNRRRFASLGSTDVPATIPEPGTMLLLGAGLASIALVRNRK